MLPTTLSLVGAVVLLLDIFAIVSVLLGSSEVMRKLLWIAVILLLPIVGMGLYFLIGRSPADAHALSRVNLLRDVTQQPQEKGVAIMSGKTDVVKGRIKEAAGALTGNDKLRAEGKTDQAVGKTKQVVQKTADTVKKAVKKVIG